jgi:dipeptidyl aminopeptidase/acylaminoacyl peptidase
MCRSIGIIVFLCSLTGVSRALLQQRRPFTVQDSIRMTTFSDPYTRSTDAQCKMSPDGKHFFVITTRGVLQSNELVSSVWTYSIAAIDSYLRRKGDSRPKPKLLLSAVGIPLAEQTDSYGSLVTDAQWASDSQSILVLVEKPDGHRHLMRIYQNGAKSLDLTGRNMDVTDFSEAGGTIAYLVATHMSPPKVLGSPINEAASDLTGLSLLHIFFTKSFPNPSSLEPALDLWVRYRGVNQKVNSDGKWHFPNFSAGFRISISPNGRALIAARPVPDIPADWLSYTPADNIHSFALSKTDTDRSGGGHSWPWQYVYVNLDEMMVVPLVDAPSGLHMGYPDIREAVWSRDSELVLFTNSYLPLPKGTVTSDGRMHSACAAAIYDTRTKVSSCIALARFPQQRQTLRFAKFGASMEQIILHWYGGGASQNDFYRKTDEGWKLDVEKAGMDEPEPKMKLYIRQDIDEQPTLWAAEPRIGLDREVWDPNPQLTSLLLGHASVYTWKDSTGYEWRAGLVLPPNFAQGNRYPLVIQTHGFSNEHEFLVDGSFTTGYAARALAAAGIVVIQMEDRADRHTRSAQQEAALTVEGFESAIDHLSKDGLIDLSRVGIIGFSRAAWYVENGLILAPQSFRAATLIDGVDQSYLTDLLFAPGFPEVAIEEEAANGSKPFGSGITSWVKNAAGFNLNKVQAPVRIEALGITSVLAEWEIYSSLLQQGKPVDLIYIPKAQHILQEPQQRLASQQGNVDWFRYWLQKYEDPDPEKRDQYRRWEHLREVQGAEDAADSHTTTAKH